MIYQFAEFRLDANRRELRRGGTLVPLEPQVFDLLLFLVTARDRVVSRDDLLEAIWRGRIVSEATLSSRINAARAAIGDSGAKQLLIRTLPRKGIRFIAEVREVEEDAAGPARTASAFIASRAVPPRPAVAVLPFVNAGADPTQDFLADGMAEEIITALSRISGLFVIARGSSFAYRGRDVDVRQVGHELGVDYVLEGSVRRSLQRLRVTGRLADAVSGATLWSERFDGDPGDVFALQDKVAEGVAAAIEPTLQRAEIERLGRDRPPLDAYDLVLRAYALMAEFTASSVMAGLATLEAAIELEPGFSPALAAAAYCRALCHFQGWAQQDHRDRSEAVARAWHAVATAPSDPQVLWMAAFAIWNMEEKDRDRARGLFRRSLLLNPNSAMALTLTGWIETMSGNTVEGRELVSRAMSLNPRDPQGWLMFGVIAINAASEGDYLQAVKWAEMALALNRRFAAALRVLAVALVKLGEVDRARDAVQQLLALEPGLTISGFFDRIPIPLERMASVYASALRDAGLPP